MMESDSQARYDRLVAAAAEAVKGGLVDAAEIYLEEALALDPGRPEVFNLLGVLMEIRRDHPKAQNYYRASLALDPTFLPARRNLGRSADFSASPAWDLGEA